MSGTLSIVIVNWNSKDHLRRCLETIGSTCADLSPKVIVVDGASFDGCGEMLADEFPSVTFMQSPDNIGFGRCNNLGFTEVSSGKVLLLNPDTELRPGAVARLIQVLDERPNAGIVSPRLLNSDGSLQTSCVQSLPTPLNQALDSDFLRNHFPTSGLWGTAEAFRSKSPVAVEVLSGACMLLQTETFRKLGGFREEFFMYGEDVDLCYRAGRAGLINVFVPDAEVVHHGGCSSRSQVSGFGAAMQRVAIETYFRLNRSGLSAASYRLLQAASALIRLSLLLIPLMFGTGLRRERVRASARKWMMILRWAVKNEPPVSAQTPSPAHAVAVPGAVVFAEHRIQAK